MVALFFEQALLPTGWSECVRLTIESGWITSVEQGAAPGPADFRHAIGVPGLPNLHSHGFQRGMAGLSEVRGPGSDSFWTWREVMYRFLAVLTPDDVLAITAQAYLEMLEGGFTRVGEFHYLHHDPHGHAYNNPAEMAEQIAAAASETGIGLTLLPCFYAHAGFGGLLPEAGQRRFINTLDRFAPLLEASRQAILPLPGSVLGIAPHSLRAVTPGEIAALLAMAPVGPVHMHIAEQVKEVTDCQAFCGARPVEWLLGHTPVDPRWCLIHATHMLADEAAALAKTGASAGLCPITEANLGDGIFAGEPWIRAGGAYGVGTDSNVLIDAAAELRQLEYAQRLDRRGRNLMADSQPGASTGRTVFDRALAGGASALGVASGLHPRARADVISLRPAYPALAARRGDALLDGWLFGASGGVIDCVWAGGQQVVQDGKHGARRQITSRYAVTLSSLLAR